MISLFRNILTALAILCFIIESASCSCAEPVAPRSVPVIHCTDLLYPPDDPDDWFDLAAVYAVQEFDIKCVVLDQGEKQAKRSGVTPVRMMNRISGLDVPAAVGLSRKLQSPVDKGLDEAPEFQQGVESILRVLSESTTPVSISVVGSARDLTAAFNRDPELLREKVKCVYVFAGEASHPDFIEWNVSMDPLAFAGLMRSGLPIVWVPCFDGGDFKNAGNSSYWVTTQSLLLSRAADPLLQYFICATQSDATSHPLEFLNEPVDPERKARVFETPRNMWGGALLSLMAGRRCAEMAGRISFVPEPNASFKVASQRNHLFAFQEVNADFSDAGNVSYNQPGSGRKLLRFQVKDLSQYGSAMTEATAELLGGLTRLAP